MRPETQLTLNIDLTHDAVRIVFYNPGPHEVRLLHLFDPLPVFFSVRFTKEDGTPIARSGGGKIDIPSGQDTYVTLRATELFGIERDLGKGLTPGRYRLSVEYHNQYGSDCFRGVLLSNELELKRL